MCTCEICGGEFKNQQALNAHMGKHAVSYTSRLEKLRNGRLTASVKYVENKTAEYNANPKMCKHCGKPIPYNKRANTFCDSICSAVYNNTGRIKNIETHTKRITRKKRQPPKPLVPWTCPVCNETIYIHEWAVKKRKCCSRKCRNALINAKATGIRSKGEVLLEHMLKENFKNWTIIANDRQILGGLELDIYIPEIKTAIEWNGIHHIKPVHGLELLNKRKHKDELKRKMCSELGITLIVVVDETSHDKFIKTQVNNLIDKLKIG